MYNNIFFLKGTLSAINFVAVKEEPYILDEQEEEVVTEGWNAEDSFDVQGNVQKYKEVLFFVILSKFNILLKEI